MIRAFLIDLFDTLVYINEDLYLHWRGSMARHFHSDTVEFRDFWWQHAPDRFLGKIKSTEDMLALAAAHFGVELGAQDRDILASQEREKLFSFSHIYPHALEALQTMKRGGFLLALVSNASDNARPLLNHLMLSSFFDVMIISCEVGMMKPDVRIYERALSALGVSPAESLFIGDGACQELDGAHEAGIISIRIVQDPQTTLFGKSARSDYVITRLNEAIEIARSLNR
jgi:putative hydrolase of the HAD superfamily